MTPPHAYAHAMHTHSVAHRYRHRHRNTQCSTHMLAHIRLTSTRGIRQKCYNTRTHTHTRKCVRGLMGSTNASLRCSHSRKRTHAHTHTYIHTHTQLSCTSTHLLCLQRSLKNAGQQQAITDTSPSPAWSACAIPQHTQQAISCDGQCPTQGAAGEHLKNLPQNGVVLGQHDADDLHAQARALHLSIKESEIG